MSSSAALRDTIKRRPVSIESSNRLAKHRQVFEELRRAIINGEYRPGEKLPTDSQLGQMFGVSRLTVMRALHDMQGERLVKRKAGAGTFVSSDIEVAPHVFGLLIPGLGDMEIFEPICQGMARTGQSQNQALLWGNTSIGADTKAKQAEELCQYYVSNKVAGVFLASIEHIPEKNEVNQRIVATLEAAGIPIVLLDRDIYEYPERSRFDLVGIDNHRAGHRMTAHLLRMGAKRVAFVTRPGSAPTVDARLAGYREALWRFGIEPDASWIFLGDPSETSLVRKFIQCSHADAVVCSNDYTAGLLMRSLSALQIDVPGELRIVGFDDVKYASLLPVPLTTLKQPCHAIGAAAIYAMLERIAKPGLFARTITLDGELVVRRSCGAVNEKQIAPEGIPDPR